MKNKKVSIIILNWNGLSDTRRCLDSVLRNDYPNQEIIVVDNGSKVNEAEVLVKEYGSKIKAIRSEKNLGYCGGNNLGFSHVEDKKDGYTVILNNDTQAAPDLIEKLTSSLEESAKLGAVGALVMDYANREKVQTSGLFFNSWLGTASLTPSRPNSVSGACFIIRNSLIKNNQIFDERFFCYWEEVDLCLSLKQRGYKIAISKQALVYHKDHASSSKKSGFFEYQTTRNKFYVIQKHITGFQKWFIISVTVILYNPLKVLLDFLRFNWVGAKARCLGLWDGLKIVFKG